MRYAVAVVISFVALAVASGADDFFPYAEGYKATYESKRVSKVGGLVKAKALGEVTCTHVGAETIGGQTVHVLEWREAGLLKAKVWITVHGRRLVVHRASKHDFYMTPADLDVKDHKVEVEGEDGKKVTIRTKVADKEEEVEVPAGKFTCTKVTCTVDAGSAHVERMVWYAKGTGVVKVEKHVELGAVTAVDETNLTKVTKK